MSLRDDAESSTVVDAAAAVQAKLDGERKAHAGTRRELVKRDARVEELEGMLDRFTVADPSNLKIPKWMAKPKRSTKARHVATPVLMLSDLHLDEVVDPAEINGANAYNRAIATERLTNVIEGTIAMLRSHVTGVDHLGIVVALLGDIVTGEIHDELAATNEAPVMDSVRHWVPILASALTRLADEFGSVHVPTVDGNHDRFHKKKRAKQRTTSSVAWVFYNWLATMVGQDDRITFSITPGPEQIVQVHDVRFLLTHGDAFRSQGGVGGLYPSMLKFLLRKHSQFDAIGMPWDVCLMGHWHQLLWGSDFVVNGSLKGFDEFAAQCGFGWERPQQALFIVTPENGITHQLPVFAD